MKRFPRFAVKNTATTIRCDDCKGKGYSSVAGFDGNERQDCENCGGFGGWEYAPIAIDEVIAEQAAWDATVAASLADVETFLGVAPVASIVVDHPNMTPAFFDTAIKRAHDAGLTIRLSDNRETAFVSSSSNPGISYLTTRTSCTCKGGQTVGRCLHRAYLIFHLDVLAAPTLEPIAA